MSDQETEDIEEDYEEISPIVPRENIQFPPPEGYDGISHPVMCTQCHFQGEMSVAFGQPISGTCPVCMGPLEKDFSKHMWGIDSRGPGFHSTKIGQKIKADRIKRNEKLATTQWDNHEVLSVVNPEKVRNPTKGSPIDPNSRFNKHKNVEKTIIY